MTYKQQKFMTVVNRKRLLPFNFTILKKKALFCGNVNPEVILSTAFVQHSAYTYTVWMIQIWINSDHMKIEKTVSAMSNANE